MGERTSWNFCPSSHHRRFSMYMFGRKELGFVHESTFFNRNNKPSVLLLAGRSWKTTHLDWRRRIAHVEPSDQKGKSRWGQPS